MTAWTMLLSAALGAAPARPVDFDTEIIPVLTKAGCNAGACHGSAAGRGEFRLSLFGGEPLADYNSIVDDLEGRRVNLVRPVESLLLNKPTALIKHGGGQRLDVDGQGARRLADWIAAGAPRTDPARQLTKFEVSSSRSSLDRPGDSVRLRALAQFDNGQAEDVTAWTVWTASDPATVEIDADAQAIVRRPGQHVVIARFLNRVVPVRMMLPFAADPVKLVNERPANFIDDEVLALLGSLRLPFNPRADDGTFHRRIRLDLTGRLPNRVECEAFCSDQRPDKRMRFIDRLLASDDFIEYWTHRLAQQIRNHALPGEPAGVQALHQWLNSQLRAGARLDAMARELLTATGDSHVYGPAWFVRMSADARSQAELVGEAFLGTRLQCANCHNHPLDRWTQDDFHGLAAVFARLDRGRIVRVSRRGGVTHPRSGDSAIPRIPGVRDLAADADGRAEFARWLTARDNPYFAKAAVNRLWQAMFGRGLVEPVDDLRDTNPATHPQLLERLAVDFAEHGYDLRHTLRLIAQSATYQGTGKGNAEYFGCASSRLLPPEVLADAWADVTGICDSYGNEPTGTRAIALADPGTPSRALDLLGRCGRQSACESSATGGGMPALLHRLNGELLNRKIAAADGRLHRLIAGGKSDSEIGTDLTMRALSRKPSDAELRLWQVPKNGDRIEWLEDAFWALLNTREFTTNH